MPDLEFQQIVSLLYDVRFVELEAEQAAANIFTSVGRTNAEASHSRSLGWLLDPLGSHGLRSFPLRRFLILLLRSQKQENSTESSLIAELLVARDLDQATVAPNGRGYGERAEEGSRFDVLVDILREGKPGVRILVEVKLGALVDKDQCKKYMDFAKRSRIPIIPAYLAPAGHFGENAADALGDPAWIAFDYQQLYDVVLGPCQRHPHITDFGKRMLSEYLKTLKYCEEGERSAIMTEPERELVKGLWKDHQPGIKALFQVLRKTGTEEQQDALSAETVFDQPAKEPLRLQLPDQLLEASTVGELYIKGLQYLDTRGLLDKLPVPFETGPSRYMLNREPAHREGAFVQPVEYKGYYMETNTARERAKLYLKRLLAQCGVEATDAPPALRDPTITGQALPAESGTS